MKDLIQKASKKDYLTEEYNKALHKLVQYDIDIRVLELVDGKTIVGKQQLSPQSHREITAMEMLAKHEHDRAGVQRQLNVIEALLAE